MASSSLDRTNSSGRGKTSSGTGAGYASSSTTSVAGDDADISDVQLEHVSAYRRHQRDSAEDSSSPDRQVYMSAVWQNGKLSVAYYDIDTMQVNMLMDTEETTDFTILRRVLTQVEPSQVVVSAKMDDRMSKSLNSAISEILTDGVGPAQSNIIQVLPSLDFSVDICKRRLLGLRLPTIPQHFLESERSLYLSSLIPFENTCLVRATGALIKYLEKARVGVELEDPDVGVPLLGLNVFTLDGQMIIDQVALSSLQIFRKESHPSAYKSCQGSGAREGLSLYGILNRCKSQIGSRLLRQWFLRPLTDMDKLKRRQDAVAFFVNPRNIEVTTNLQDCLKHIKAVPKILTQMIQAQASIGDWQALYKTAYNAIYIGDLCRAQSKSVEIFTKIGQSFTEDLHRIATLISKIVDFDESALQNRFVVKAGVDTDLDEKKRTYNGLPDYMTNVARQELDKLSADITECNIIYLPQLGYLLAIPQTTKMKEEENFGIPGLEFVFLSNNMAHYKSTRTRELDSKLGDTQCDITDHETTIMHRLQNTILEHSQVLVDVMQYAAELDCLMSLATCAREFCYTQPELTDNGEISITAGRHPLQELCCSPFVPNPTESGGDHSRVKILTGPNASGKSVYIKQVALIVFMAHLGSFVPAERASVCVTDRIFTRVKSLESVAVGLSTFMLDLNQMSDAVRNATENSLVVIDEFGKGTEAVDGVSLLCSAVKHWLSMGRACPHVFVSTHFHKALQQRLMSPTSILTFQTMETVHNAGELVFLYQLIEGHCSSSYACHVAAQAGLPAEIISRGAEVSKLLQEDKPVYRVDSASTETQMKRCNVIVSRFLELDLETADLHAFLRDFVLPASNGEI